MNIRLTGRGTLARTAAVSVTALAVLGLWAPAAQAAPTVTIPLDPDQISRHLAPLNGATAAPTSAPVTWPSGANPVQYSGSVTVTVPPEYTATSPVADLRFYYAPAGGISRTYSSASSVPADQLALTDLGGNQFRVDLPADDGTHACCYMASVSLYGFTSSIPGDPGLTDMNALGHTLDLSGGGPASVSLESWTWVDGGKCADLVSGSCAITKVADGTQLQVTLPASSSLTAHGIADLSSSTFYQVESDRYGTLTWAHSRALTATISADGRTASVAIPAGSFSDVYAVYVMARPTDRLVASASLLFQEQAVNKGLRSNTGWGEHEEAASSGTSPLVPIGATMIVMAGASTALVLRRRTSQD